MEMGTGQSGPVAEYAVYLNKIAAQLVKWANNSKGTKLIFPLRTQLISRRNWRFFKKIKG